MRLENSIKNVKASLISQILNLLLGFTNRIVFIKFLGSDYLGFSGLFSNILSMLALTELGIGTSLIYNMYQPMNNGDNKKLRALCVFYRNVYILIAVIISVIGLAFVPIIHIFIKDINSLPFSLSYIRIVYLLSLSDTVVSYLFVARTVLLNVGQQNYVNINIRSTLNVLLLVVKICVLFVWGNYVIYCLTGIFFTVAGNVVCSLIATKRFKGVFDEENKLSKLSRAEKKTVFLDAKNLFVHSISAYVVNSTDNLIISSFVGISALGILTNYTNMVFFNVKKLINGFAEAIQAPLGDLVAEKNIEKTYEIVLKMTYIFYAIGAFCAISLCVLSDDFMYFVFGSEYIISYDVVIILSINLFVWTLTRPVWRLAMVTGLFKQDRKNAIIEALVNAIVSLIGVQFWGVFGTFFGTLCSTLIAFLLKTRLQFTAYFNKKSKGYFVNVLKYSTLFLSEFILCILLANWLDFEMQIGIVRFFIKIFICLIFPNFLNLFLFRGKNEGKYLLYIIKNKVINKFVK